MRSITRSPLSLVALTLGLGACDDMGGAAPHASTQQALLGIDADVSVTVTDQVAEVSPGMATTYRIVVRNQGPLPALAVDVRSVLPANLTQVSWTCTYTLGSFCAPAGTGAISERYGMGVGASSTYLVRGVIAPNAAIGSALAVTASTRVYDLLGLLLTDANPANDTATDANVIVAPAKVPTSLQITAGDAQTATVGTALASSLQVTVRDQNGAVLPNVPVAFAASALGAGPAAQLSAGAVFTDAQGKASVSATLGTTAGAFQITATAANLPAATFQLTARAGAPASVTPASGSSPQSAGVGLALNRPLSVVVHDVYGNPTPNVVVGFHAPVALGASLTLSAPTATTNAAGVASVTGVSNGSLGVYTVTGSVAGVLAPALFVITNVAGAPLVVDAVGCAQSAIAGHAFDDALDVRVLTSLGVPIASALVNVSAQAGVTLVPAGSTGADGHVAVHATAGLVAGDYDVTLSVLGGLAPATCKLHVLPDVPARLVADAASANQTTRVGTPFAQPFGVTLYDQYDNRIANAAIHFDAPLLGISGTFQPALVTTDAQGHAASVLTAGDLAGPLLATAHADNPLVFATFAAHAAAGSPHGVIPLLSLPRQAVVGTPYLLPLGVHVQDASGNAVPDAIVRYQVPAAGASAGLSELTAKTDLLGNAAVSATANTVAGTFAAAAAVDGALTGVQFSMENLAGAAAQMTVSGASSPQGTLVNTTFAEPLTAHVQDQYGNPVQGALVTFLPPLLGASALPLVPATTTNALGVVSVSALANSVPGAYEVMASTVGASTHFALENLAMAPGHLVVESGGGQHAPATQPFAQPLVVRFVDGQGTPVQGAPLTVSLPTSGPSAEAPAGPIATDAEGRASIALTAGAEPGSVLVSVSVPGAQSPATTTVVADAVPTSRTLEASATSVVQGRPVTLTASAASAFGTPSGTVQLRDAQTDLGGMTLVDGRDSFVVYLDALGDHSLQARFEAQGRHGASESAAVVVHVHLEEASSSSSSSSGETGSSSGGASSSSSGETGSSSGGASSSSSGETGSSGGGRGAEPGAGTETESTSEGAMVGSTSSNGGSQGESASSDLGIGGLGGGGGCSTSGGTDGSAPAITWIAGLGLVIALRRRTARPRT